ncbi:MAG: DNA polymerase III subunit epsilon [Proteobacteria bacterium]|nr:DNA polymerase III subunit epsilon [Pseudomonadota bacterium]
MREVVLDTETTGLDPGSGHRIVEIGCVELVNHVPTGREYQTYLNPDRDVPEEAFEVHGLATAFLATKPRFAEVVDDFLAFLGSSRLIIHNAEFDLAFLNAELERLSYPRLSPQRSLDTLELARRQAPGAPANLDALARRFALDTQARRVHGALVDARILAEVYLRLTGGRQPALLLKPGEPREALASPSPGMRPGMRPGMGASASTAVRAARPHAASGDEQTAHAAFIDRVTDPIWRR